MRAILKSLIILKFFERIPKSRKDIAYKLLPAITLEIIRRYLRVDVHGVEHVPKEGRGIVVSNHSGFSGFDALMIQNEIRRANNRTARLVAHKLWFLGEPVKVLSTQMGLIEAGMNPCLEQLQREELLVLFPEGEAGNFKASYRRYRLQEFKRGFVRLAMVTGAPIIPTYVIGAEETHINISQLKFLKPILGTVVPIPLNIIPLPVQWRIQFLPAIEMKKYSPKDALNRALVFKETMRIRRMIQRAMVLELRKRKALNIKDPKIRSSDLPD